MTKKVIDFLKKLFLWSKVVDRRLVYSKISEYLPCTTQIINDSTITLDFGKYQDINVAICLKFIWDDNNVLIDILNNN